MSASFPPPAAPPAARRELIVTADGGRLDRWLAAQLPGLSRARLQALMAQGLVTLDGRPARPAARIRRGQRVNIAIPAAGPAAPQPEALPLDIVYEDADLLVLDKPPGLVVHPSPGHAGGTLVNALLHHCQALRGVGGVMRPGIVHRLDKDTSGLLAVAKHDAAFQCLAGQFRRGRIGRTYLALVHGRPVQARGTIIGAIGRHPRDRKRMAVNPPRGKPAVSRYEVVRELGPLTLLRVRIETGRTHQIRVHLAHLGHPVAGDPVYGNRARDRRLPRLPARQMLHAAELELDHPADGRRLIFRRPPPPDMLAWLETPPAAAAAGRRSPPPPSSPAAPRRRRPRTSSPNIAPPGALS